jgi:WD40 repeat protein/tRNA A-37 threonylcarbamoyl transferase component Bud32
MAQLYVCPKGHRSQLPANVQTQPRPAEVICPVCGVRAQPAPASPAAEPPTLPVDNQAIKQANGQSDQTLLGPSMGETATDARSVPGYDILAELGRGGMGVVYKARQAKLNRVVALKMILAGAHASAQELARFRSEAEAVAPLQHPHIVQIYEVGEHQGHPYFSLEYIEGGSLAQQLDGAPQPTRWAAQLVETLARAIHFAHERGIIHRDLKPANILLTGKWERGASREVSVSSSLAGAGVPIPKITDFGLAKRLANDTNQTKTGAVLGTPSYIAPEQAAGKKDIGPPADVYALGAILYELLTGRPPFRGETPMDTMLQVMSDEPVPPSRLQPKVPRDLETICLKCLEKNPAKRYANAEALAEDLRRFLNDEPIQARPISLAGRGMKWARRSPAVAALVLVVALAVLTMWVASLWYSAALRAANAREMARAAEAEAQRALADAQREQAETQRKNALAAQAETERQRQLALERIEHARRSIYALQLTEAAALAARDPGRGLELLNDKERCPSDLRDFTWGSLRRLCQRERASLGGGEQAVPAVAWTANGKTLAAAVGDIVVLWEGPEMKPRELKRVHNGPILAIAFAPGGATLASAGFDKSVVLWDVASGEDQRSLEGHSAPVRALAFSPDGKTLASGSDDNTVRLWDVPGKRSRATLSAHKGPVTSVSFAEDGRLLASGSADRSIRLWDPILDRELLPPLPGHAEAVLTVAFAPGAKVLASGGSDSTVKLWDIAGRKEIDTLRGHTQAVNALAFAPDGRLLATASSDGTARLWRPATGEQHTLFRGHAKAVRGVAFAPDGKTLASSSADGTIKLWLVDPPGDDAPPFKVDLGGQPPQPPVSAFGQDATAFVTVKNRDKAIRLWNLLEMQERVLLNDYPCLVTAVALSADDKLLAVGGEDQLIRIYDDTGRLTATLKGHKGAIHTLAFGPDGRLLLSGGADGSARLWDAVAGTEKSVLRESEDTVRPLALSADGRLVAFGPREVKLWNGSRIEATSPPFQGRSIRGLAFAPDGKTVALWGTSGPLDTNFPMLQIWNLPANKLHIVQGPATAPRCLAFSPDGKTLATGLADWSVVLWDAQTGQQRGVLTGHTNPVYRLAFTADSKTLVSVADDGEVRLWRAAKGDLR